METAAASAFLLLGLLAVRKGVARAPLCLWSLAGAWRVDRPAVEVLSRNLTRCRATGGLLDNDFPREWNAPCLEGRNLGDMNSHVSLSHGLCGYKAGPSPQQPPSLLMRPMP